MSNIRKAENPQKSLTVTAKSSCWIKNIKLVGMLDQKAPFAFRISDRQGAGAVQNDNVYPLGFNTVNDWQYRKMRGAQWKVGPMPLPIANHL